MTTPKIVMPELAVGQAGKEITHNDALAILDQLVQARVVDKDLATPPGSPANGAAYIVASSPTGAWVGHTNHIAYWLTAVGVWQFLIPAAGWEVWVTDESLRYTFGGSAWAISSSQFTGGTMTSAINEAPIVTIASAATVNIGAAAANTISISGTVTITAFDTIASGALRRLHFQGALTLTHNGTSLILPTAANITTAAGDVAEFVSLGSGNWRCTGYERANGTALAANVVGPASSGNGNLALFDGTTGKVIKDGGVVTTAGLALLDDVDASAQRTTLGVGVGNSPTFTALTLTNGQIVFPAVQVPSANANTLDDYEEGTWTPTMTFTTPGDLSVIYSARIGTYTKTGRLVALQFQVTTTNFTHTTASGDFRITGFPFTAPAETPSSSVYMDRLSASGYSEFFFLASGIDITGILQDISDGGLATATTAHFTSGVNRNIITNFILST